MVGDSSLDLAQRALLFLRHHSLDILVHSKRKDMEAVRTWFLRE